MNVDELFKLPEPVSKKRKISNDHHVEHETNSIENETDSYLDTASTIPAIIDTTSLKKMILKFEKALSKNTELRSKYPNDPLKYMDSEMDLAEEVKNMTGISSVPHLFPVLLSLDTHLSLLSLLSHENTDITVDAISLLNELFDEDALAESSLEAEAGTRKLLSAIVDADGLKLLVQNLSRLNEEKPDEKQGVFHILSLVENIVSIEPSLMDRIVQDTNLMPWLLSRIDTKAFDSVRQYASEILAILLQTSRANRLRVGHLDGIDKILHSLAAYRKKDPKEGDEIEMMENLFDSLCSCLAEPELKKKFLDAEGMELILIMIKEKKMSHMRAIKVLDHALLGGEKTSSELGHYFIRALGLKTLFSAFLQKGMKRYKKDYSEYSKKEEEEHVMSILYSLFATVDDTECRQRLLFKFMENEFEKTIHLVQLHKEYSERLKDATVSLGQDLDPEEEDELYLEQLDAGLITLQNIDLLICYVCNESIQIKDKILDLFSSHGLEWSGVQDVIQLFLKHLGDEDDSDNVESQSAVEGVKIKVLGLLFSLSPEQDVNSSTD